MFILLKPQVHTHPHLNPHSQFHLIPKEFIANFI